jgi:hypothetical protein
MQYQDFVSIENNSIEKRKRRGKRKEERGKRKYKEIKREGERNRRRKQSNQEGTDKLPKWQRAWDLKQTSTVAPPSVSFVVLNPPNP